MFVLNFRNISMRGAILLHREEMVGSAVHKYCESAQSQIVVDFNI